MKKYKLLKDLPTYKAGDKFYLDDSGNLCAEGGRFYGPHKLVAYANSTLNRFPAILTDWFEEINDKKEPWRAKKYEPYCYIDAGGYIWRDAETHDSIDDWRYKIGNYFRSEEEAERAKVKLEAYATIKRDAKGFEPNWLNRQEIKWWVLCNYQKDFFKVARADIIASNTMICFKELEDAQLSLDIHQKEWRLLFDLDKEEEEK